VIVLTVMAGLSIYAYIILSPFQGVRINLPKTSVTPINRHLNKIEISVSKTHYFVSATGFISPRKFSSLNKVKESLEKLIKQMPEASVLVRGSQDVDIRRIVNFLDVLQAAGAKSISLVTASTKEKR